MPRRHVFLFVLLTAFWGLSVSAETSDELKIMIIGDSLTAGYGLSASAAYPKKLEEMIQEKGLKVDVINAGVSGDTTKGGLRRLDWQLKAKPDWVVLALGGNDMLRGISPKETEKQLSEMIQRLQSENIRVFLFGMQASGTLGKEFVDRFDAIYPRLAKAHSVSYFPLFIRKVVGRPELNLKDGIHPNETGHQIVAGDVFDFLWPHLKSWTVKKGVSLD